MTAVLDPVTTRAVEPPTEERQRPRWSARTWRRAGVVTALVLVVIAHLVNVWGWPVFGDDEGTYTAQAWAILHGKLAHYTYWYDHPPAGWIQLAGWLSLPQLLGIGPTVATARIVMVGYAAVTAYLIYRLARQVGLGYGAGLAALLVWGLYPLVIFESRQVLLDNLQLPWLVGSFVLATSGKRRLWAHVAAGVCFGVAVLTKETGLVLAPALLLAVWSYAYRPTRWFSMVGFTTAMGLTGALYPLFALLKGELLSGPGHVSLADAIGFQLVSRAGSGLLWDPTSNARAVVDGWLQHDPLLPVAGLVTGVICLLRPRVRPIGLALVILAVVGLRPNGYLPIMFVIAALPFAAISVVAVAERAVRLVSERMPTPGRHAVTAVAALATIVGLATLWTPRYAPVYTATPNADFRAAVDYLSARAAPDSRVLVDDAYWTALVDRGWQSDGWNGAIWYYKLDLDPIAQTRVLPDGWRDVDYLIANDQIRNGVAGPQHRQLKAAYDHSIVLASWGSGERLIEVRQIIYRR